MIMIVEIVVIENGRIVIWRIEVEYLEEEGLIEEDLIIMGDDKTWQDIEF